MGKQSRLRAKKRVLRELVTDGSLAIGDANDQYRLEKGRETAEMAALSPLPLEGKGRYTWSMTRPD